MCGGEADGSWTFALKKYNRKDKICMAEWSLLEMNTLLKIRSGI